MEGFRTMAARTSRLGRMSSVHTAAITRLSEAEVGGTSPGAIENQQLLLDEYGLGHHGTRPARTGEPGDSRQKVENQGNQVAHVHNRNKRAKSRKC